MLRRYIFFIIVTICSFCSCAEKRKFSYTSEEAQEFLNSNAKERNYVCLNYGEGVWLQIYNILGFRVSDEKWLINNIPTVAKYITVVELKNTPGLIYLFSDSKRIDLYNKEPTLVDFDLSTVPKSCENLIVKDYRLKNIHSIKDLDNLKAIDFKCDLNEFVQIENENLKYIGIELCPNEIFNCEFVLKFPHLEELHIYNCSDIKNISALKNLKLKRLQISHNDIIELHRQELNELKRGNESLRIYSID